MGLSPVSVVSRCIQARPRATPSVVRATRDMLGTDPARLRWANASAGSGAWHPDWAESGPSRIGLAWPLRQRPLLAEAGCVGPFGLRARLSGRARTRPGRITSSFRWTAPFETELPHLRFTRSPTRKARATRSLSVRGRPRFARRAPSLNSHRSLYKRLSEKGLDPLVFAKFSIQSGDSVPGGARGLTLFG